MPYYKKYNYMKYERDFKTLEIKVKFEFDVTDRVMSRLYKFGTLSAVYEILLGAISTKLDISGIKGIEGKDLFNVNPNTYIKRLKALLGEGDFTFILQLSRIRNLYSHSIGEVCDSYHEMIEDLDFISMCKFIVKLYKVTGMGKELLNCLYITFPDKINITDIFESKDQYDSYVSLVEQCKIESTFERAVDYVTM